MDKTFKQKLEILPIKNIEHPVGNTKYYAAVHVKSLIAQADEEFQELLSKYSGLNDNYEKEVIRSSKLESQIIGLKSQLQQQALPVVPECVAGAIESLSEHYSAFEAISLINAKVNALPEENEDWLPVYNWLCEGIGNQNIFALAFITGKYEVEKPQLFYLKNKLTRKYLRKSKHTKDDWNEDFDRVETVNNKTKFTQQEINSMQTGSYEQIEVTE